MVILKYGTEFDYYYYYYYYYTTFKYGVYSYLAQTMFLGYIMFSYSVVTIYGACSVNFLQFI